MSDAIVAIVDSNVVWVANGDAGQANAECQLACIRRLKRLLDEGITAIDDRRIIVGQYLLALRRASGRGGRGRRGRRGPGSRFVIHILAKEYDACHVQRVAITPTADGNFTEFPNDTDLANFDRDDRVFVAVCLADKDRPPIVNAVDSDWRDARQALNRHGIVVEELCPQDLKPPSPPTPPRRVEDRQ